VAVRDSDAQAAGEHDLVLESGEVVIGQASADADDGDAQPAGPQLPEQARRRRLAQAHLKPGMLAAQQGHRPRRQHRHRSREHAQLDPSCQPVAEAGQILLQGVDTGQYPPRMFHHDGARPGHARTARLTDEQRMPGCRLDGPDLPRDGRL
jgi:hypothetical protein